MILNKLCIKLLVAIQWICFKAWWWTVGFSEISVHWLMVLRCTAIHLYVVAVLSPHFMLPLPLPFFFLIFKSCCFQGHQLLLKWIAHFCTLLIFVCKKLCKTSHCCLKFDWFTFHSFLWRASYIKQINKWYWNKNGVADGGTDDF